VTDRDVAVFFYGLFMDVAILRSKGVEPSQVRRASVDGYALNIGDRASLSQQKNSRVHGVVMTLAERDLETLYAEKGLTDYRPETVTAELEDGSSISASCYNLPRVPVGKPNPEYIEKLRRLAMQLELPGEYVDRIGREST